MTHEVHFKFQKILHIMLKVNSVFSYNLLLNLARKDRYNKKLEKYHVVVEEGDEEVSDLEEMERHVGTQAGTCELPHKCL